MTGQIYYKVMKNIGLTLIYYEGVIDLDVLKEHFLKMGGDPDYSPEFNAITDFGECEFVVTNNDVKNAVEFVRNSKSLLGKRKQAFIFRTPKQQAISSLFSMLSGNLLVTFNVVSSLREAKMYVDVKPDHYKLVQQGFRTIKD